MPIELSDFQGEMSLNVFSKSIASLRGCGEMYEVYISRDRDIKIVSDVSGVRVQSRYSSLLQYTNIPMLYFTLSGAYVSTIRSLHDGAKVDKWEKVKGFVPVDSSIFVLNSKTQIETFLKQKAPYAYEYANSLGYPLEPFLTAPELELFLKAGYVFAERMLYFTWRDKASITAYNRLVNSGGKNIKELFKTEKPVYSCLKEEPSLKVWDNFRRMYKKGRLTAQEVSDVYYRGYGADELSKIDEILRKHDEKGRPYFSFNSLLRYLDKIDMYEAICFSEGIYLLSDYLRMCSQLEVKPNLTSDSLKREHDVTARIMRNRRNELLDKRMKEPCREASSFDYTESTFFIRSVVGYDDLVDEAMQQRNCVASYGQAIADRKTMVFVMRTVNAPDRSLATVELTPNGDIRQVRLAYNRPMHSKAQSDFLKRWRKEVLKIMHGKTLYAEHEGQLMLSV